MAGVAHSLSTSRHGWVTCIILPRSDADLADVDEGIEETLVGFAGKRNHAHRVSAISTASDVSCGSNSSGGSSSGDSAAGVVVLGTGKAKVGIISIFILIINNIIANILSLIAHFYSNC